MAATKHIKFYPLIASCSLNSTALIYSNPIDTRNYDSFGIQARWTGAPVGNFFLDSSVNFAQGSSPFQSSTGDWVPSSTSIFQALGTSGLIAYPPVNLLSGTSQIQYPWYRMRYVPSSAATTGVLDVWVSAKEL